QNKITDFFRYRFNKNTLTPPLPSIAVIDPINICNLDCPLCATKIQNYPKCSMSVETCKIILNKIPSLRIAILFNWGEPFLNKEIFEIIEEINSRNIYTIIHSNFSFETDKIFFEKLVNSGLKQLIISLDGASQNTYEKYRRNGDFGKVIQNIKTTTETKKKFKKRNPKIIWKYIVNKFNENEIELAKKKAKELGIEIIFDKIGLSDDIPDLEFKPSLEERRSLWLPRNEKYILPHYKKSELKFMNEKPCNQLFTSVTIAPDGKVVPCCWITDKTNIWGDLLTQSFEDIWYNEKYKYSRSLFNKLNCNFTKTICSNCKIFKKLK
ncbi:MAG: SPASM domain-containing protein, partial [Ignavibacteriales bacterium]|nr:SPASM domain-containing protein [Ignavibacteriales bacterium]